MLLYYLRTALPVVKILLLHELCVEITAAESIYVSAMHLESFVSLDAADHLLTKAVDSEYVLRKYSV